MADNNDARIDNLERRFEKMEGQLVEVDKTVQVLNVYLKSSSELLASYAKSQEKLSDAINSINLSINTFSIELKHTSEKMDGMQTGFDEFKKDVADNLNVIKHDVEEVDEKSKFDIMMFLRKKVLPSLLGGGALLLIYEGLEKLSQLFIK